MPDCNSFNLADFKIAESLFKMYMNKLKLYEM